MKETTKHTLMFIAVMALWVLASSIDGVPV